jgi:aminomethyltransferase
MKRTPLYSAHVELGARIIGFGGWDMPVQYTSIVEEHLAVRQHVGLFDISHMGDILVSGPEAAAKLNKLLTNDVTKLDVGTAQYSMMCNETGGIIDDLYVYRIGEATHLLIVNAANIESDFAWIRQHINGKVVAQNISDTMAALALQGPDAPKFFDFADELPRNCIQKRTIFDVETWISRTGYTGEDGFELFFPASEALKLWAALLIRGREFGIQPCGLGARDTLRLEVCYPLHGHDIDPKHTPVEAGLTKFVAFEKGNFIGRDILLKQRDEKPKRQLVAFKMAEKSPPPRQHYKIFAQNREIGIVTSGTQSPSMNVGIGMGYVESEFATVGTEFGVEIRGKIYRATVEKKPLYRKP